MPGLIYEWGWLQELPKSLPALLADIPALEAYLSDRLTENSNLSAAALIQGDGALIAAAAWQLPENMVALCRQFSAQFALGQAMSDLTGRGDFEQVTLKYDFGYIWLMPVHELILVIVIRQSAKI